MSTAQRAPKDTERRMHAVYKAMLAAALLAIGIGTALASDPTLGTWKLNIEKSTFSGDAPPKAQTRIYSESPQGIMLTVKTIAANGEEAALTLTFRDDGQPYPVSNNVDYDSASLKRVNRRMFRSTLTKAGITVATGLRTVSKDGKKMTVDQNGTHSNGVKYHFVAIYERQ